MSSYPPPPPTPPPGYGVGGRIEEIIDRIEQELRGAVDYVNSNVVPQVRRESVTAMRSISETLKNLADRMDKNSTKGPLE